MNKFFLAVIFLFPALFTNASDGDFAVSKIPAPLLKNANVIKRTEEETFELKNAGEAYHTYHYVLTIMNENGDKYAELTQFYNKFVDIRSIGGTLYDANGKEVKKLKNKDLQDVSGTGDESLIDDTRYKVFQFYYKVYPYTVEYNVEVKYNGTMFYPYWQPCDGEKVAVEESHFIFSCPSNYEFRYKALNYQGEPAIQNKNDRKIYTWQVKELPAILEEDLSSSLKKLTTYVRFGPTDFEMQNYKGNMRTWQDLGKFVYTLRIGRDDLPAEIKQKVHQLTDGVTDQREKIRLLYQFLQSSTRYISIQLGMGGWQPFDAKYVSSKGFGDCKALSNYMYSLLKEAGIKSFYTLITAGDDVDEVMTDFPSASFNHVILFAPVNKDTIWLECTSQTLPAGYLGEFTSNRWALAVDENGGILVHTPKYDLKENLQIRKVKAVLDDQAYLDAKIATRYEGLQQDHVHELINYLSKDKIKEHLQKYLDLATYDINSFDYKENKSIHPFVDESLDISISNYATITGKRLFIQPNIISRSYRKLKSGEERKYDIVLKTEYNDIDSVEIELPKGYEPEVLPQNVSVASKFGNYSCSVSLKDNKIYYYREVKQYSGIFPSKDYDDLVKYYDAVYKADRNKLVFVKKENN